MVKLPDYTVEITSPQTGEKLFVIPLVQSYGLKFSRQINHITPFALTLPYESDYEVALNVEDNPDTIIDIYRTDPDGDAQLESSFLTRDYEHIASDDDDRIVISGVHCNDLIRRRYIDPDDDSIQPNGGYATKAGIGSTVIRDYIYEQCVNPFTNTDRIILGLTVPAPTDSGLSTGGNFRYNNLWDEMVKLANQALLDIEVRHTGSRNFECVIGQFGTNRSAISKVVGPYCIFDPNLGNLANPQYRVSRKDEITFVRVQGSGARDNRTSLPIQSPHATDSVFNRIEATYDSRNTPDTSPYTRYIDGLKYLKEKEVQRTFQGEPLLTSGGAIYRTNWFFGDTVTVRWDNVEQDIRIRKIDFEATENNETIGVKLDNE